MKNQTWLVTGATGLIGQALVKELMDRGHHVRTLGRTLRAVHGAKPHVWSPAEGTFPLEALEGVDVVVHLAAASVGQRWTGAHKRAILESRTLGTHLLRESLVASGFAGTWIQASAIGIYGNSPNLCDEHTPAGQGFLADVAEAWEQAAQPHNTVKFRLVRMRLGLVLSPEGGTLAKLLPIYKLGLGAPLGSGRQLMGWVHLEDVLQFITWAAATPKVSGAYNVVAPRANTNEEFSQSLAKALSRPHWAPKVPGFALSMVMGEMSSLLLEGQNVRPTRLLDAGFAWKHPELFRALTNCVCS